MKGDGVGGGGGIEQAPPPPPPLFFSFFLIVFFSLSILSRREDNTIKPFYKFPSKRSPTPHPPLKIPPYVLGIFRVSDYSLISFDQILIFDSGMIKQKLKDFFYFVL